jgi:hypothetical protein
MANYDHLLPDTSQDVNEENLKLFFSTMHDRQEVWFNKTFLKKPAPWTTNKLFRDYKFTNVYRELDRSSQFLIKNCYLKEDRLKQILFSILIHRVINKPETIEELGGYPDYSDFNLNKFVSKLHKLEQSGFKTLNDDAYKINTYVWGGIPRYLAYAENIIGVYHKRLDIMFDIIKNTRGDVKNVLSTLKIFGVGSFLIHEYYQDFCDVEIYTGQPMMHFNRNSWTNVGPGCSFGLRLIFPSMKNQEEGLSLLRDIAPEYLPEDFKYVSWNISRGRYEVKMGKSNSNVNLHTVEMWNCELGKYWKMLNGVGKKRQKYVQKS